jgi:hypothetical protein
MARRMICASDLRIDFDRIEDNRAPSQWIYLEGVTLLERIKEDRHRAGVAPCQVCGRTRKTKRPLSPRSRYCLGCDSAGLDGIARYPGLDVDSAPNVDWEGGTPTKYVADPKLAGGKG